MARMRAIEAAVEILKKEGISVAFGVPGAAINPLYAAMKNQAVSITFWPVMLRALRIWLKVTLVAIMAILACVSAHLALRVLI